MRFFLTALVFVVFTNCLDARELKSGREVFQPVIDKMLARGADTAFVYDMINMKNVEFNEKFVRINVIGYLKKADYSKHYNSKSVKKTSNFLEDNLSTLNSAEKKFGVPKEVIASVLWIETRHGNYLGRHHVLSVFLSTALANEKKYLLKNKLELIKKFKGSKKELEELKKKLIARSEKKANWALGELMALVKLHKVSPIPINELKGSWAGAFGISQFLPSSYINWAVDGNGDMKINLFDMKDAIYSVANYLKVNGWGDTPKQRRKAVFHYNNSDAYVDAVLRLATKISKDIDFLEKTKEPAKLTEPLSKQMKRSASD